MRTLDWIKHSRLFSLMNIINSISLSAVNLIASIATKIPSFLVKFIFAIMCARATVWPAFIVGQTGKQTESWLTGRKKHWYVFIIRKRRMVI